MRKCGILCLILILSFLLGACTPNMQFAGTNESSLPDTSEDTVSSDTGTHIEYKTLFFNTKEEYDAYFTADRIATIPSFVSYDMIAEFGSFDSFVFTCLVPGTDPSDYSYMYSLSADGFDFSVYVDSYDSAKTETANIITKAPASSDLRTSDVTNSGFLTLNNVTYNYVSGKLVAILWQENGKQFTLHGDLWEHPLDDTLIGKMLYVDTAQAAMDSIEIYRNETA